MEYENTEGEPQSPGCQLTSTYLHLHVRRRLIQFVLTGDDDLESLEDLIESTVDLCFEFLVTPPEVDSRSDKDKRCKLSVLQKYEIGKRFAGLFGSKLGSSSVLGEHSAFAEDEIIVNLKCSMSELRYIYDSPEILIQFTRMLELVIPVDKSFSVRFHTSKNSSKFSLGAGTSWDKGSTLGVSTRLTNSIPI